MSHWESEDQFQTWTKSPAFLEGHKRGFEDIAKAKQSGLNDTMVIGVYIFYNLIYALFAFPIGIIADKVGLKNIFVIGLILFSLVYLGMSANTNLYLFFVLFFLYGIYASATEGISKAWISNITDKKDTATAIGTFSGLQSICAMIASSMAVSYTHLTLPTSDLV